MNIFTFNKLVEQQIPFEIIEEQSMGNGVTRHWVRWHDFYLKRISGLKEDGVKLPSNWDFFYTHGAIWPIEWNKPCKHNDCTPRPVQDILEEMFLKQIKKQKSIYETNI